MAAIRIDNINYVSISIRVLLHILRMIVQFYIGIRYQQSLLQQGTQYA